MYVYVHVYIYVYRESTAYDMGNIKNYMLTHTFRIEIKRYKYISIYIYI